MLEYLRRLGLTSLSSVPFGSSRRQACSPTPPSQEVAGRSCHTLLACDLTPGPCLLERIWTAPRTKTRALRAGSRADGGFGALTSDRVVRKRAKTPSPVASVDGARPACATAAPSGERWAGGRFVGGRGTPRSGTDERRLRRRGAAVSGGAVGSIPDRAAPRPGPSCSGGVASTPGLNPKLRRCLEIYVSIAAVGEGFRESSVVRNG